MSAATKEEVVVMENLGNTADFNVAFSPNKKNSRRLKRQATRIYKRRFRSILTEQFGDEESWWLAAEAVLKEEGFAVKVTTKSQEEGEKPKNQIIVEVMVDVLLDMEGITVHQGLVYVLDEGLASYPMEFMVTELLKRGADPNKEKGYGGSTPLHLAITEEKMDLVKRLLEEGAHLEIKDDYGYTPLLQAVKEGAPEEIIDLLLEHGASVHALAEDRKTALHFIAQRKGEESMMRKLITRGLSVDGEDNDGWTPLHEAAHHGSKDAAEVLTEKGTYVNARDHRKRTPLHVAAEEGEEELITFLLDHKADSNVTDLEGNTPLDLAARKLNEKAVNLLLTHSHCSRKDDAVKKTLEKAMDSDVVKDDLVKGKIGEMSPLSVVSMFKSKKSGGMYQFLKQFATNSKLKKSTKAIMDQFVLGKTRGCVNCEIIEADVKGTPPDEDDFDESSQSLLDVIVEQNDKELAQHPSIQAILDYKWKTFGRWLFVFSFMVYAVRMLFFGLALLIAARPDLDNPGCYRDGWDYLRGICEGISLIFFLFKLGDEIQEIFSFPKVYFKDYYNYMQLIAVILPFLIIPFRAATTWCASTGVGYCVDPTLLPNSTNTTPQLDINQACITASSIQWIVASLAYLANAILVVEFLALFRTTGVYVRIIYKIIVSDMLKFSVLFVVALYIFVGTYYLALRAGVTINMDSGDITSDLEVFELQTLYPWHVVFTALRILIETGDLYGGNYFAVNDDGEYIGYQWFSIVMYLTFLFGVVVVLLNLLIAQMSDTYTKIQEDVEGTFAIARARIIARLQKGKWLFCKETYRKRYFKKEVWTELSDEELKHEEEMDSSEEKVVLMQQKIDRLEEMAAELTRRLQKREDTAMDYKSMMEQKVDRMETEVTKRLLERENTAREYKSMMEQRVDRMEAEVTKRLLEREDTAREYKSLLEQKVEQLTEIANELTRKQLEREATALEYKSVTEQKIDRLTEMTAELTRRLQRDVGERGLARAF